MTKSKLIEMNNVGIVVESLDNAISFFTRNRTDTGEDEQWLKVNGQDE